MLCAVDKDRYSFGGSVACNNEIETGMSFTARFQLTKGSKEGCLLGQKMACMLHTSLSVCGFRLAHIPLDSVLHTSLSMCAFRVAHIPFYVCIPCYIPFCVCIPCCTHPFLCVHSVLHPFLCVHSVLHTSLSMCAFHVTHIPFYVCIPCYTHPFLCVHSVLCAVDCPLQDSGWSCQSYYKKEDCGKKGYVKDPMFCPILCGVCAGELCILSHPLWSVSR